MLLKMKKSLLIVGLLSVFISVSACSKSLSNKLTVTHIHDVIVLDKTTVSELEDLYGEPYKVITNPVKVERLYEKLDIEGGINDNLDDVGYWETLKVADKPTINPNNSYDAYYEFRGNSLGVKSVYFFTIKKTVTNYMFNNSITNKSVAKKDKYLRQIID